MIVLLSPIAIEVKPFTLTSVIGKSSTTTLVECEIVGSSVHLTVTIASPTPTALTVVPSISTTLVSLDEYFKLAKISSTEFLLVPVIVKSRLIVSPFLTVIVSCPVILTFSESKSQEHKVKTFSFSLYFFYIIMIHYKSFFCKRFPFLFKKKTHNKMSPNLFDF